METRERVITARRALPIFAVILLVLVVYLISPIVHSGDGRLVIYEADSVLHEQNLDLHEFGPVVHGFPCYREGERILSRYPYGAALVATPLLAVVEVVGGAIGHDPTDSIRQHPPRELEKDLSSVITALAVGALMLLALEALGRVPPAILLGVLFAFGTALWSTVSRGLWQHGPEILLFIVGLFCLVSGGRRDNWRWLSAAGLPLAAAYVVRPTAVVPIGLTGLVLLATNRKAFLGYVVLAACVLLPSIAYNFHVYGKPVVPFYLLNSFLGSGLRPSFPTGLSGTMISPARGLLVYSPFVALALAGLWLGRDRLGRVEIVAAGSVLGIWFLAANTLDWPGGWSWGPRLLSDTLPFLAFLMLPVVDAVTHPVRSWSRVTAGLAAILALSFAWSVFVNARGSFSWATQIWNMQPTPVNFETTPDRFFDWSDPPFLRTGKVGFKDVYPSDDAPAVTPLNTCVD